MTTKDEPTHQPARMIVGHCPECQAVVVVFNNFEVWPPIVCACGWNGGTNDIDHYARYERAGVVIDEYCSYRSPSGQRRG